MNAFPQDGCTAVFLATYYGHTDLVHELCESFGADVLHRMKVRAIQTDTGNERLNELCKYPINSYL